MKPANNPILAREGWAHCALALALALTVTVLAGWLWALPFWLFLAFNLQFFRDPPRAIPDVPGGVVCPADGRIVALGEVEDPYLKRPAARISIFMNVVNVHANRMPVGGEVKQCWYHAGRFVNAALDKASNENERNAVWLRTDRGEDVVVVQVAGLIARRILCYVQPGQRVQQGERYGFIRFGSRVDVYLPRGSAWKAGLGDKVKGGSQLLALLPKN